MIGWMLALGACGGPDEPPRDAPTVAVPGDTSAPSPSDTETPPGTSGDTATPSSVLPPFDDVFLWQPITFDDAIDLAHSVKPVPPTDLVEPGPTTLAEVGEAAFLGNALGGGNSHGVGVGFFDVDGDGWADVLVANGRDNDGTPAFPSQLWRNLGDGTFADVSAASGVGPILMGLDTYSVAAADYDGDGDVDVHVTAHPTDVLLQNQGDGTFVDATAAAGLGGPESVPAGNGSSKIGAWGDYDNDGWLDVFVASSQFVAHPPHGYLMRNNGDGTFSDVSDAAGVVVSPTGNPCAVMWTDYDNDGWQDLMVWNDRGDASLNRTLLRNRGDGTFTDVTAATLLTALPAGNPMGVDGADANRDGWLDYYVGNIGGNVFALSRGDGTFINSATASGVQGEYGWGLGFEDLNHDGWWDLFVAQEDERDYLTFTHDRVLPPTFTEDRWSHGPIGNGHNVAVAFADYDHDGDVDIVTAPRSGARLNLFRNDTDRGTNRWLEVRVPITPSNGSFGGITGRVVVKTGDTVLWRDLTAGSSRASQNALSARFGLGQYTGAAWVAVVWPTGEQRVVLNVEGNQVLDL